MARIEEVTVGKCYLFDDVTSKLWLGRVIAVTGPHSVVLENAAWVADTGGRLHVLVKNGRADGMEIEPVGVKGVHWAGWVYWPHEPITSPHPEA
jgi:hypothetical protein